MATRRKNHGLTYQGFLHPYPHPAQVVRYSALISGVFYGIFHRQTLQAKFDSTQAANEVHKREEWLKQAKEAWAAKTAKNDGRKSLLSARVVHVRVPPARTRLGPQSLGGR
jgi:F-type H+-transporting ATP synthase subunit e